MRKAYLLCISLIVGLITVGAVVFFYPPDMIERWTWPEVSFEQDNTWLILSARTTHKEAFVVTEEDNFRWLRLVLLINGERVGEGAGARVRFRVGPTGPAEFPSQGIYSMNDGSAIYVENVGAPIKRGDNIEVLYDNVVIKFIGVV